MKNLNWTKFHFRIYRENGGLSGEFQTPIYLFPVALPIFLIVTTFIKLYNMLINVKK